MEFTVKGLNMTDAEAKKQVKFISNLPDKLVYYSETDEVQDSK